jgi:hypothetical protein
MLPILTGFFPPVFRAGANVLFHSMGSNRVVLFEPFDDPRGVFDTKMSIGSDALGYPSYPSSMGINSVRQAYVPPALVVAVILATPMVWPRKWRTLLLGLLLALGFIAIRVGVALLHGFSRLGEGSQRMLEVSGSEAWLLRQGDQILTGDLHMTYIAPLLIWLIAAVRIEDLRGLWGADGSQGSVSHLE